MMSDSSRGSHDLAQGTTSSRHNPHSYLWEDNIGATFSCELSHGNRGPSLRHAQEELKLTNQFANILIDGVVIVNSLEDIVKRVHDVGNGITHSYSPEQRNRLFSVAYVTDGETSATHVAANKRVYALSYVHLPQDRQSGDKGRFKMSEQDLNDVAKAVCEAAEAPEDSPEDSGYGCLLDTCKERVHDLRFISQQVTASDNPLDVGVEEERKDFRESGQIGNEMNGLGGIWLDQQTCQMQNDRPYGQWAFEGLLPYLYLPVVQVLPTVDVSTFDFESEQMCPFQDGFNQDAKSSSAYCFRKHRIEKKKG